jgi:hypothetical protein
MGTNSNPKGEGVNSQTPLGTGQKSTNEWLGIDSRIAEGTTGSRPDSSSRYGGDGSKGELFKGNSVATDNRNLNSGGGEKASKSTGQYGNGEFQKGGIGSRENMPKYGGETNEGRLVGLGAGATKPISATDQLQRDLPKEPGLDLIKGTSAGEANMAKAKSGIGKPGKGGARM